jgi:hypothetical protein
MANEKRLLRKLGLAPKDCWAVDCYWRVGDDVVFLETSTPSSPGWPPGLWARRRNGMLYLTAVVDEPCIDRKIIERIMKRFEKVGLMRLIAEQEKIGTRHFHLDEE